MKLLALPIAMLAVLAFAAPAAAGGCSWGQTSTPKEEPKDVSA